MILLGAVLTGSLPGCDAGTLSGREADAGGPTTDASSPPDDAGSPPSERDAGDGPAVPPDAGSLPDEPDPEPMPTGAAAADEIVINETIRLQTLDGIGANAYAYPYADDQGWNWSAVRSVFDEIDLRYLRLASWFEFWEPENDNEDPYTIDWSAFDTGPGTVGNHDVPFAQFAHERGMEVSLGVWNVGDWLAGGSPRRVDPARYHELGESIVTYMINMERNGVPQPIVEVQNEPGIEAAIQYASPEELRRAALALLDVLDHHGMTDVMLHGPNEHRPARTTEWAEVWFADERLRSRTAALSYHTWWDQDFETYDAIRQIAERYGVPVWATETGYCAIPSGCFGGASFLLPETWATAWDYAMSMYRSIVWTRATRIYHWAAVGNDGMVRPDGTRTPSFFVLKHFANWIEPGARLLETASGDEGVLSMAFLDPSGDRTVILLNTRAEAREMRLRSMQGHVADAVTGVTTTESSSEDATSISVGSAGEVDVSLPPRSVTSLRLAR